MATPSPDTIAAHWPAARTMAAHAANPPRLDPGDLAAVRAFTLDTIAVGIAGRCSPYADGFARAAMGWGDAGSGPVAHRWADGARLPPPSAAMVNAFQAHALEFDCVHEAAVLHPFTVVAPVLLAEAEARGMSGARFVDAAAIGVDVAAGLGAGARSQIRFFRPATCGLFGATAALGHARGLDADTIAHALGYALAFASGTMQAHTEGTPALAASVGAAARSAFAAVDLAQAGLPGPMGSLDGPYGYWSLFEAASDPAAALRALAEGPRRVRQVSWKPFPTGRACHGGIDMVLSLRARGLDADNLERLDIVAPPLIHHLVGRPIAPAPLEVNYARLCLPWAGAVALLTGGVGLDDFQVERLNDPRVHALAARIHVSIDPAISDQAAFAPQSATATLRDGRVLTARVDALLGAPARPLDTAQAEAKARACIRHGFGGARPDVEDALIAMCGRLELLEDAGDLARVAAAMSE